MGAIFRAILGISEAVFPIMPGLHGNNHKPPQQKSSLL
jgi:hypothetical protein